MYEQVRSKEVRGQNKEKGLRLALTPSVSLVGFLLGTTCLL